MASTWTAPQFHELGMDCEINSYFDEFQDERGPPVIVPEKASDR